VDFVEEFPWHALYATNALIISRGYWIAASHFWSLAVEEQFYLVWPIFILFVPWRVMPTALVLVVLTAPAFRVAAAFWFPSPMIEVAAPAQLDALGLGSLLAWLHRHPNAEWECVARHGRLAGLMAAALSLGSAFTGHEQFQIFLLNVAFMFLVHAGARGVAGPAGSILRNPSIRYVGRISYGVYLLHNFADIPASAILRLLPWLANLPGSVYVLKAGCTVALAALSWHVMESRINDLKRYFPYASASPSLVARELVPR